jgi:hypothetical protein
VINAPDKSLKVVEATRILNEFVGDLIVGTQVMVQYAKLSKEGRISPKVEQAVLKMCLSHLIITLTKFTELYMRYKDILPKDCVEECKKIFTELERRNVREMRNKVFAHIWDDDHGRPLKLSEIILAMERVFGPDTHVFLRWINDPKANEFGKTVIGTIEFTRDRLIEDFKLTNEELFPVD